MEPDESAPNEDKGSVSSHRKVESNTVPFFRRVDWFSFVTTLIVSLVAYILTLAPTVTLEDSGELVVAADYLGVPHPPGYPIWTLLAWFFQWIFHFVTYHGQPNPAWAVGFMSAFFGAMACAIMSMLISRSGFDMLRGMPHINEALGHRTEALLCWAGGVSGGLLLAFSPVLWSQSVIVEVYSLNAFFLAIILLLTYRWMCRPREDLILYTVAFLFGLGLTNHQSLLFAIVGLVFAISYRDLPLLRDCMAGGFWLIAILLCYKAGSMHVAEPSAEVVDTVRRMVFSGMGLLVLGWFFLLLHDGIRDHFRDKWWTPFLSLAMHPASLLILPLIGRRQEAGKPPSRIIQKLGIVGSRGVGGLLLWGLTLFVFFKAGVVRSDLGKDGAGFWLSFYLSLGVAVSVGSIALLGRHMMTQWKRFIIITSLVALGLSFYLYLPIASDQSPPMNWGYPRTEEGFWHALKRGQYEKISIADNIKEAFAEPAAAANMFYKVIFSPHDFVSVTWQFTWPMAVFALLCFIFIWKTKWPTVSWFIVTLVVFVFMTFVFLMFQYPDLDVQTLFIGRVQYIQAHAIYALWLSYGIILGLGLLMSRMVPGNVLIWYIGVFMAFLFPFSLIFRNAYTQNENFRKMLGGVEQNGHDFGWQFGNYQLRGAKAIHEELEEGELPPPSKSFPPEMEPNAIFFGGTDPGRFVPTYMIYSAKVREDVFLITQNALADNTYMAVMRDLYGDKIWIPSVSDSNRAFKQYVEDVRSNRISAGAKVVEQGGRVSVQGVQGVMMINGILTKDIFDYNKHKHAFYIEESYVIPWMYPYLTPHGLIMKLNKEQRPNIPLDIIKDDRDFWTWYTDRLLADPKFQRDVVARKTFSKLRSAIGGLYVFRRNFPEAEYAFKQSIALYDLSPEANFRLSDALLQQRKFDEAIAVINNFLEKDKLNDKVRGYRDQLIRTRDRDKRRAELEPLLAKGADVVTVLELLGIYRDMGQAEAFKKLADSLLSDQRIPLEAIRKLGQLSVDFRKWDIALKAYQRATQAAPQQHENWIELAAAYLASRKNQETVQALQKAVETGGDAARRVLREDKRFDTIRNSSIFQRLAPSQQAGGFNFQVPGGKR